MPQTKTPALPLAVGVFAAADGRPATEQEARAVFASFGWTVDGVDDEENAVWLVFPDAAFRRAYRHGYAERAAGDFLVAAEV